MTVITDRFDGKTVLVTGAGSGIGAATAERLAPEGAHVFLTGRGREKLDQVSASLRTDSSTVVVADSSRYDEIDGAIQRAVTERGRLHTLVKNGGSTLARSPAKWDFKTITKHRRWSSPRRCLKSLITDTRPETPAEGKS
jgi:NADP-dependent 3-hydroxy acid dehydrogenase YdfG